MDQEQEQYQGLDQASNEEKIRTRAYYLWEQATDPKGTPDEYWEQARTEVEKESPNEDTPGHGVLPAPTPTPARKS
ncbi:hypothetical protein P3T40_006308 [Paraburkholderia sp. EB58]|jgi:hypothetical protein|uniref:DUF2934 domain-containing protein n=1 Tax=Paraburkholderia sp. EB58 TaxID=3035125 RepID=UPI003D238935